VIEFLCPNGHKIHCPDEQAGRAAKCPQCGAKFHIPEPSQLDAREAAQSDSSVAQPALSDSGSNTAAGVAAGSGVAAAAKQESQIEFLCPNGHRLHGPASLQGRPGQCPECGSKFRIPSYDDVSEEEEMGQEIAVGRADGTDSGMALPQVEADEIVEPDHIEELREAEEIPDAPTEPVGAVHSMGGLFSKLWARKPGAGSVEMFLEGGDVLVPDRFADTLSRQSHGVFAVKESDGTYTLTVVAWDSVAKILVRGVGELPDEMSQ